MVTTRANFSWIKDNKSILNITSNSAFLNLLEGWLRLWHFVCVEEMQTELALIEEKFEFSEICTSINI